MLRVQVKLVPFSSAYLLKRHYAKYVIFNYFLYILWFKTSVIIQFLPKQCIIAFMKKKKLTTFAKVLMGALIAGIIIMLLLIFKPWANNKPTASATPGIPTATPVYETEQQKTHDERAAINPEYRGELAFESGLLDEYVVQASDNDKYLSLAWDLTQSSHGAAFMDYRNNIIDQNIVIYGHFVYADESLMFGPLTQLLEEENYEPNKYFTLTFENETRTYIITDVYHYIMDDESLMYFYPEYDQEYFDTYYAAVKEHDFYDTGESITMDDHWVTLQTCVCNHEELRLIVIGRQIDGPEASSTPEAEATTDTTATPEATE